MPEELSQETGGQIQMPSALRIRQRLGHVSTSKIFRESFVPKAASRGGQRIQPQKLMTATCWDVMEFALDNSMDPINLAQNMGPRVLKQLVDSPQQREEITVEFRRAMDDETFLTTMMLELTNDTV